MLAGLPLCLALMGIAASVAEPEERRLSPLVGEGLGRWTFADGAEFPGAAGALETLPDGTLRLAFDFTGGGAYVAAYRALDEPLHVRSIRFRARKPSDATLTLRATDSTGQTLQKPLHYESANWQSYEASMSGWTGHWGGADDGLLHQPVRAVGLLVEGQNLGAATGEVLFADVVVRLGDERDASTGARRSRYTVTDFADDTGFGVGGPASLRHRAWRVDFARGDSTSLHHSIALFGAPRALRLTVSGGPARARLRVRLGSHFQTFERVMGTLDGTRQTFEVPAPPEGWAFGGGENDGRVRHPLRLVALVLERADAPREQATLVLGPLECDTDVADQNVITLLGTVGERRASEDTRALEAVCRAWNLDEQPVTGTLSLTARDWEGAVLHRAAMTCTLPARGRRSEWTFPIAVPAALNFAEVDFAFEAEGRTPYTTRATYTRPSEDPGDNTLRPDSPWGMGVYLYRYPHNPDGHALMDRAAALAQAAGVKWSREEFSWARTEPRPGEYDFAFYDVVVDTAWRHGISVYGLLSYWSSWTKAYTEEGIADFCRWARAVVRHFKGRVKHWEVYNEPNIFFWQGPKELYPVLLTRCYAAIKEEDPDALVLGISTAGIDRRFIQFCLDAEAPFDILTVHPYRRVLREGAFQRELRETAALVGGRPVWITEMGWSTQVGGADERAQALLLARCYLSAVASGASQNVSWYDFRSDGPDPFYNEHNFGVLRPDLTPKPAYRALTTLCRTLSAGEPRAREDFGEGVYALELGDALAIWSPTEDVRAPVRARETVRAVNLMGEEVALHDANGTLFLDLRAGSPIFCTGARLESAGPPVSLERTDEPSRLIRF